MKDTPHASPRDWKRWRNPALMLACLLGLLVTLPACVREVKKDPWQEPPAKERERDIVRMKPVSQSDQRWTGVAALDDGRLFMCYPRWSDDLAYSLVVRDAATGQLSPYPDAQMNQWRPGQTVDPAQRWVCVQSVVTGPAGHLFVLDAAKPKMESIVPGGAKLVQINPALNKVVRTYRIDEPAIHEDSYLNDVRFDETGKWAVMTDSGRGGLIVLNLLTGHTRRVLDDHPKMNAEKDVSVVVEDKVWEREGVEPQVHADGIAIDHARGWVYFKALTADTLYRLPLKPLLDSRVSDAQLSDEIQTVAQVGPTDGLEVDAKGRVYLTSLRHNAILRWSTHDNVKMIAQHDRLIWPDSLAWGTQGTLFATSSQINRGDEPGLPFEVWMIPNATQR